MSKVAVVSGANQGLGFALVEALCRSLGPEASVYLTARNRVRGEEAVHKLHDPYIWANAKRSWPFSYCGEQFRLITQHAVLSPYQIRCHEALAF